MTDQRDIEAKLLKDIEAYLSTYNEPKNAHGFNSKVTAITKRVAADSVGDREQHLTWTIANEAYTLILDSNLSAKDALIQAAENHTEEVEAVLAEKSNRSNGMNKSIVKNHDKHPVQKDMVKHRKFNRQGMRNTKNVWQMLNLLSYFREAYREALDLQKVKEDVAHLQTDVMLAQEEIARLQQKTGNSAMTDREKASVLKRKGYSQTDISKAISVHRSTVSRWWDTL